MKHKETTWGWMLAVDFFFAGMGGAMVALAGASYLFFDNHLTTPVGNFVGAGFVAVGAGFLILELGRPLQALRVFMNPKAILTFGAWKMTLAIGCGLAFATFSIEALPWAEWLIAQKALAGLCIVFGVVVAAYPGVLLARHKGRPFWTGPGIVTLFLLSSSVTGMAAHDLSAISIGGGTSFNGTISGLLLLQPALWGLYLFVKRSGTTAHEAKAAQAWVAGKAAFGFWGVLIGMGSLIPVFLLQLGSPLVFAAAEALILLGGGWMRWMVVKSGEERTWLPGEEFYRSRLPKGDEEFLQVLK